MKKQNSGQAVAAQALALDPFEQARALDPFEQAVDPFEQARALEKKLAAPSKKMRALEKLAAPSKKMRALEKKVQAFTAAQTVALEEQVAQTVATEERRGRV